MKKLHRQLFWLLIFLLPVQLGRHFWFEWTQVLGLPIDYLSPILYLTDLLVIAILFLWWLDKKEELTFKVLKKTIKSNWWLLTAFVFLFVNAFLATNRGVAFYKLIKILEFAFLGLYIVRERYATDDLRYPLSGAVIYSSLIAIAQFIKQGTIGGIFWWLGERSFNLITPGIAKAIISGRLILRPYATFPHPNVLAGFILVALILIGINRSVFKWAAQILGSIAILLSFSRATWLIGLFAGLVLVIRDWRKKKGIVVGLVIFLVLIGGLFYRFALPLSGQEAITQRFSLAQIAIRMIKTNFLAGVGLNNFIPRLPDYWQQFGITYWLQPVHNIFLLIAAETGLVGLVIFLWLLVLTYRRLLRKLFIMPASQDSFGMHYSLFISLTAILLLGLFDHYWFTLQQTQLLLTVVFGLSWKR